MRLIFIGAAALGRNFFGDKTLARPPCVSRSVRRSSPFPERNLANLVAERPTEKRDRSDRLQFRSGRYRGLAN